MKRALGLMALASLMSVAIAAPAQATFPGANGKIAFYTYFSHPQRIGTIDPDGTNRTLITSGERRSKVSPAWSADGSTIAFISSGRGPDRLMTMAADGTGAVSVFTSDRWRYLASPSWSSDGTELAVGTSASHLGFHILVVNIDGSGFSVIDSKNLMSQPAWSPDGTRIAYVRDFTDIYTMNPDGTGREMVTEGYSPDWSPDASQLVYANNHDIFVVSVDGTGRTRLTDTARRVEYTPAFSPDGTKIAFDRTIGPDPLDTDDIWIMDTDGTNAARITDTPKIDEFDLDWQAT
jgi:Tol biopolymer transport system component